MCLVVVDPRLLVRAFEDPHNSRVAKLLSLFMYGRVCLNAHGVTLEESDELEKNFGAIADQAELARVRADAARSRADAERRRLLMDDTFVEHTPSDLLLASSRELRARLCTVAEEAGLDPDRVNRQVGLCTAKFVDRLDSAPFELGLGRHSEHEYLIRTAVRAAAGNLISEDEDLLLPGNAAHVDPKSRNAVHPYTFDDFVRHVLPYNFTLDAVDAPAVLRVGVRPLSSVEPGG